MTQVNTIDGRYIIFPEGSAWEYRRIRNGVLISETNEASLSSHVAARDSFAWIADLDFGNDLDLVCNRETCRQILDACEMTGDTYSYTVCRVEKK